VDGVINIRDIGGYLTQANTSLIVKPGVVFRSGEPSCITDLGKEQLHALGIKTIFDLRSDIEMKMYNIQGTEIEGVRTIRVPILVRGFDPNSVVTK
jgi:protein tyrosine/serine phosphatase